MKKQECEQGDKLSKSKEVAVPEKILIDFKVKNEDWSIFQLADGTTIKSKLVLINVFARRSGKGFEGTLQLQNVLGAFSPEELRGKPSEPYAREELGKSIVKDDVDVAKVVHQPWNEYELDNGMVVKIKNVPVNIARTSKYDREGMPVYLVDAHAVAKVKRLKKSKRSQKKRK